MSEIWRKSITNNFDSLQSDDHLEHFGIKGMKWGIRRFQNADGSLTDAGKRRYSSLDSGMSKRNKEYNKRAGKVYGYGVALGNKSNATKFASKMLTPPLVSPILTVMEIKTTEKRSLPVDQSLDSFKIDPNGDQKQQKKQKMDQMYTLARASLGADYGKSIFDKITKKMSKDTKKGYEEANKIADEGLNFLGDRTQRKNMNQRFNDKTNEVAINALKDMGWDVNPQNIYYLTQILWGE